MVFHLGENRLKNESVLISWTVLKEDWVYKQKNPSYLFGHIRERMLSEITNELSENNTPLQ